ncbi:hypothetical protein RI844_06950 [Thalassotalea fonticola]|uniref:Uncharacterized protein n=1 Tax=Thalassotalea fonticola TaxID=3065649 RepID=A0ABZ0GTC4_9GAMM|nr:hypothetical protein RI844_06950 [Colwelliaceae bacterium S1-1]
MVSKTFYQRSPKVISTLGVMSICSSVILSGFVVAAPLLAEQDAPTEQVNVDVNANAENSTSVPVANEQPSSDDVNSEQQTVSKQSASEQGATINKKRTVITLESTIVGDKEQPKVLSIVPWQKPEHQALSTQPVTRQIEMKFHPVEVDSLNRELQYYKKSKEN